MSQNVRKNSDDFYTYFSFDKNSKHGSIRGRIYSLQPSTYNKDGNELKMLRFTLIASKIDNKVKYILDVEPTVSDRNPDIIYINCTAFGTTAERLEKFLQEKDEIFATGYLSSYEGKSGNRVNFRIQDVSLVKRHGQITSRNSEDYHPQTVDTSIDDDDEIPF